MKDFLYLQDFSPLNAGYPANKEKIMHLNMKILQKILQIKVL